MNKSTKLSDSNKKRGGRGRGRGVFSLLKQKIVKGYLGTGFGTPSTAHVRRSTTTTGVPEEVHLLYRLKGAEGQPEGDSVSTGPYVRAGGGGSAVPVRLGATGRCHTKGTLYTEGRPHGSPLSARRPSHPVGSGKTGVRVRPTIGQPLRGTIYRNTVLDTHCERREDSQ